MRFPKDCENLTFNDTDSIRVQIQQELDTDYKYYQKYVEELLTVWEVILKSCIPIARSVYGFEPSGIFNIIPTAYGTGGGQLVTDGPLYSRIPMYGIRSGWRNKASFLVHEILAHGVTAKLRDGSPIDESTPKCSHQWHKERLMDLLGRTFLTRSGHMSFSEVHMQKKAFDIAGDDIDTIYYVDNSDQQNSPLRYEGNFSTLLSKITERLS